jgi:hypothetical protein
MEDAIDSFVINLGTSESDDEGSELSNHDESEEDSDSDLAHPLECVYVQHTLKMCVQSLKENSWCLDDIYMRNLRITHIYFDYEKVPTIFMV